jgi:Tol biopolymer transport system component
MQSSRRRFRTASRLALVVAVATATTGCSVAWTSRVNVATDGVQADSPTFTGGVPSADGRLVAFASFATTLVPNDTNGATDVFVRDTVAGTTERVSVASDESQADSPVTGSAGSDVDISPDGRFVLFHATFDDLVAGAPPGIHVYLRDRVAGTTELVDLADGEESPDGVGAVAGGVSADGRLVTFATPAADVVVGDTNGDVPCDHHEPFCDLNGWDVFVRDRVDKTTTRVSVADDETQADRGSTHSGISDDGRSVAFTSPATNLVPGDTNDGSDIFVRDLVDGATELVNVALDGSPSHRDAFAGSLSADGRFVTFMSTATDLVPGDPGDPFVDRHIYLRDRVDDATERVDVSTSGVFGNRLTDPESSVSADGRYVVFSSVADNLVPGDTNATNDIFLRDRLRGTLERVSLDAFGRQAADESPPPSGPFSFVPRISDDGRYVTFSSQADNLVPGDTNGVITDVFIRFVLAPVLTGVAPPSIGTGAATLTISGARFLPDVTVAIAGGGVTIDDVTRVDETTLLVDATVAPDATPGPRDLRVTNLGVGAGMGGSVSCGCLTVE